MCVVLKCCGIDIGNNRTCLNLLDPIKKTGLFEILTSDKYTKKDSYLKRGDIVNASHTHVSFALEDGCLVTQSQTKTTTTTTTTTTKPKTTTPTKKCYSETFPVATISQKQGTCTNIKRLQKFLNWYGNYNLKVDGIFGAKSLAAVKDFQTKEKLDVDGIVGPKTVKAMKKVVK